MALLQDAFDVIRVIDQMRRMRPQPEAHDIAVLARGVGHQSQYIAAKRGQMSGEPMSARARRESLAFIAGLRPAKRAPPLAQPNAYAGCHQAARQIDYVMLLGRENAQRKHCEYAPDGSPPSRMFCRQCPKTDGGRGDVTGGEAIHWRIDGTKPVI